MDGNSETRHTTTGKRCKLSSLHFCLELGVCGNRQEVIELTLVKAFVQIMFAINILIIIRLQLAFGCVRATEHIRGPTHERHRNHIQHFLLLERIADTIFGHDSFVL